MDCVLLLVFLSFYHFLDSFKSIFNLFDNMETRVVTHNQYLVLLANHRGSAWLKYLHYFTLEVAALLFILGIAALLFCFRSGSYSLFILEVEAIICLS